MDRAPGRTAIGGIALSAALACCASCGPQGAVTNGNQDYQPRPPATDPQGPGDPGNQAGPQRSAAAKANNDDGPVTFYEEASLNLASPDSRYRLINAPAADGLTRLIVVPTAKGSRRQVIGDYQPPTSVLWSPASDAFFVNDQRGSGQSSYLEVVRHEHGRFRRDTKARLALKRLYNRLFECALSEEYINTSGESWADGSRIVVEVRPNLHSGGCPLDPFATNRIELVVDAKTGQVLHRRLARP